MSRRPHRAAPRFPLSSVQLPLPASAKHMFRSSLRFKSLVTLAVLTVLVFVVYAFDRIPGGQSLAGRLVASPHAASGSDGKPPLGGAETLSEDGRGVNGTGAATNSTPARLQRSFEEPDFALLSGLQPHEIGCDVPLEGEDAGPLVFLGIFSSADKKRRRDL